MIDVVKKHERFENCRILPLNWQMKTEETPGVAATSR